jgi:hypothetical protein
MTCHLQMTHCTSFNIYIYIKKTLSINLFSEDQGFLKKRAQGFFFKKLIFNLFVFLPKTSKKSYIYHDKLIHVIKNSKNHLKFQNQPETKTFLNLISTITGERMIKEYLR